MKSVFIVEIQEIVKIAKVGDYVENVTLVLAQLVMEQANVRVAMPPTKTPKKRR